MRHGIAGNKLNRNQKWREATVRDIAKATLIQQRICTTKAKAKEARKLVDKLITMGKKGTLAEKRRAFAILCDHKLVSDLFNKTSPRFKNRVGGYTRLIPIGNRRGDNAQLTYLELTEKEEIIISESKTAASGKTEEGKIQAETAEATGTATKAPKKKTTKAKKAKAETKEVVKEQSPKDSNKSDTKKAPAKQDKGKSKNIVGGIRKMFNRKSPGGK